MTQGLKNEAFEQLLLDIEFGFENEEEIFDSIKEMFHDEEEFDENWLRQNVAQEYERHQRQSLSWIRPNDFDRLAKAFDQLINEKIVSLHKAGFTRQDGEGDCAETIERLNELGIKAIGFCYYHSQDLARAVDKSIQNLYLGFGSSTNDDNKAVQIGEKIVSVLKENTFEVSWKGSVDQRIEIKNIIWQKVPDHEDWGADRVIKILSNPKVDKKPFWKFW
nr:hypothetical protein [uncultured Flavobacterium sp.]